MYKITIGCLLLTMMVACKTRNERFIAETKETVTDDIFTCENFPEQSLAEVQYIAIDPNAPKDFLGMPYCTGKIQLAQAMNQHQMCPFMFKEGDTEVKEAGIFILDKEAPSPCVIKEEAPVFGTLMRTKEGQLFFSP